MFSPDWESRKVRLLMKAISEPRLLEIPGMWILRGMP